MKITQVEPNQPVESASKQETTTQATPESKPDLITIVLSVGIATFRMPTAMALMLAERTVGGVQNSDFSIAFYRQLATDTCLTYGDAKALPEDSSLIKAKDDNKIVLTFIERFREASVDAGELKTYATLEPNGSSKRGFGSVEVTLTNGDKLTLDEPSMASNVMREQASTNIEGVLIMASNLCRMWSGEEWSLAEYRLKFNRLSVDDFFRVSNSFTLFR